MTLKITNKFDTPTPLEEHEVTRLYPDGEKETFVTNIAAEHEMDVVINTIPTFRVVCSPDHLPELAVGRLITEGYIESTSEIDSVFVCQQGSKCEVFLTDSKRADFSKRDIEKVQSCCTGNKTLNSYFESDSKLSSVEKIDWDETWLFSLIDWFSKDSPSHKKSFATHSAYLSTREMYEGGKDPYMCEDLGRHNAFDKVVGAAAIDGVDLRAAMLFTTGRVPVDMVIKAIRAKIPILVTKAVPTSSTLELAKKYELTLICSAHSDSAVLV